MPDPVLSSQQVFTCLLLITLLTDKMLLLIPLLRLKKLRHKVYLANSGIFPRHTRMDNNLNLGL